jgi:hypothetical protein
MLFFELTNFSAVFFQKNLSFSHFCLPPPPYTLLYLENLKRIAPRQSIHAQAIIFVGEGAQGF